MARGTKKRGKSTTAAKSTASASSKANDVAACSQIADPVSESPAAVAPTVAAPATASDPDHSTSKQGRKRRRQRSRPKLTPAQAETAAVPTTTDGPASPTASAAAEVSAGDTKESSAPSTGSAPSSTGSQPSSSSAPGVRVEDAAKPQPPAPAAAAASAASAPENQQEAVLARLRQLQEESALAPAAFTALLDAVAPSAADAAGTRGKLKTAAEQYALVFGANQRRAKSVDVAEKTMREMDLLLEQSDERRKATENLARELAQRLKAQSIEYEERLAAEEKRRSEIQSRVDQSLAGITEQMEQHRVFTAAQKDENERLIQRIEAAQKLDALSAKEAQALRAQADIAGQLREAESKRFETALEAKDERIALLEAQNKILGEQNQELAGQTKEYVTRIDEAHTMVKKSTTALASMEKSHTDSVAMRTRLHKSEGALLRTAQQATLLQEQVKTLTALCRSQQEQLKTMRQTVRAIESSNGAAAVAAAAAPDGA